MKKIGLIATVLALVAVLAGCETEAQRVSYNLSQHYAIDAVREKGGCDAE